MFGVPLLSTSHYIRFRCISATFSAVRKTGLITKASTISPSVTILTFHTTPARCLHPALFVFVRMAVRASSLIVGRFCFHIGWKNMGYEKKKYYKKKYFYNPLFWAAPIGVVVIGGGMFYFSHLESAPITNRKRFVALSKHQMNELSNFMLEDLLKENERKILKTNSAAHIKVLRVVNRLVKSNKDIEQVKSQEWSLHVIDDNIVKAFVLPNGHIFVFTGLLKISINDDQLAFVLGHEMAHSVLSHAAENISFTGIVEVISALVLTLVSAIMPADFLAILLECIRAKLTKIALNLPFERSQELEADRVGLYLVAKACYDVRESSILFKNLAIINDAVNENSKMITTPEFLSTHPSHEKRAKELEKSIPEAIERRKECKCPELKGTPHSFDLHAFKMSLKKMKAQ